MLVCVLSASVYVSAHVCVCVGVCVGASTRAVV